jgi:hypothetical protein
MVYTGNKELSHLVLAVLHDVTFCHWFHVWRPRSHLSNYTVYYGKNDGVNNTLYVTWCGILVLNLYVKWWCTRVRNYLILFLQCYMMLHSAIHSMTVIFPPQQLHRVSWEKRWCESLLENVMALQENLKVPRTRGYADGQKSGPSA